MISTYTYSVQTNRIMGRNMFFPIQRSIAFQVEARKQEVGSAQSMSCTSAAAPTPEIANREMGNRGRSPIFYSGMIKGYPPAFSLS
jgi:hypothetical protein